jgi:hypothetical protein
MVTCVCKNKHVVGDSEIFSIPASISEDRHLPLVYKFLAKNALLSILLAGLGELGGCLICTLQLEKNQVARVVRVNSATCCMSVTLKSWVAWV